MDDKGRILEIEMQARAGIGLGAFMEKKIGNLDMKGRRASTAPVLSQNLANSVSDVYAFSDNKIMFMAQRRLSIV